MGAPRRVRADNSATKAMTELEQQLRTENEALREKYEEVTWWLAALVMQVGNPVTIQMKPRAKDIPDRFRIENKQDRHSNLILKVRDVRIEPSGTTNAT